FYEQFEDLPGCLLAAHEMVAECICDLAESACAGEGDWEARKRVALDGILSFLAEEPPLAHLLGAELAVGAPAVAAARERLLDRLAELGAGRRSLEGALALVSELVAAGDTDDLPQLAPQLADLIRRAAEPGRRRRGAPAR